MPAGGGAAENCAVETIMQKDKKNLKKVMKRREFMTGTRQGSHDDNSIGSQKGDEQRENQS